MKGRTNHLDGVNGSGGGRVRRRDFLAATAAAALTPLVSRTALAQAGSPVPAPQMPAGRGTFVIRGGAALTMDPALGDIRNAEVLIADGRIRQVGASVEAPAGAQVIDATNAVILPGFVDTHWHMWTAFLRGIILDGPTWGYFPIRQRLATHITADDHYVSVLFAQAEALNAGITTVCNHSHGLRTMEDTDAELRAHLASGGRAVFAHGAIAGQDHHAQLDRVMRTWISGRDGMLGLMMMAEINAANVQKVRQLGIMITAHSNQNAVVTPGRNGLLGPDVQLVHLVNAWGGANREGRQLVAKSGAKVSMAPFTAGIGPMGFPSILDLLADGVAFENLALSTDTSSQASADFFAAARQIMYVARQTYAERNPGSAVMPPSQYAMTPRRALELATIGGARNLNQAQEIGSLTPGKKADLIIVRLDDLNMISTPNVDLTRVLVQGGQPSNVDTVMVDGRLVKQGGRFTRLDAKKIARDASEAQARLQMRAGLPPVDPSA